MIKMGYAKYNVLVTPEKDFCVYLFIYLFLLNFFKCHSLKLYINRVKKISFSVFIIHKKTVLAIGQASQVTDSKDFCALNKFNTRIAFIFLIDY